MFCLPGVQTLSLPHSAEDFAAVGIPLSPLHLTLHLTLLAALDDTLALRRASVFRRPQRTSVVIRHG